MPVQIGCDVSRHWLGLWITLKPRRRWLTHSTERVRQKLLEHGRTESFATQLTHAVLDFDDMRSSVTQCTRNPRKYLQVA
jgi:hypothetical protein